MELHVTSEPGATVEEGHISMEITGLWAETITYEVPVMSILSEAYFLTVDNHWTYEGQEGMFFSCRSTSSRGLTRWKKSLHTKRRNG